MGRPPKQNLSIDLQDLLRVVGRNVTIFREEMELTQAELAKRSKISMTTINEIETRQFRDIRLSTLSAIAKTLEVPVIRLLESAEIDLSSRDQAQFLKASEAIWKIAKKLRPSS